MRSFGLFTFILILTLGCGDSSRRKSPIRHNSTATGLGTNTPVPIGGGVSGSTGTTVGPGSVINGSGAVQGTARPANEPSEEGGVVDSSGANANSETEKVKKIILNLNSDLARALNNWLQIYKNINEKYDSSFVREQRFKFAYEYDIYSVLRDLFEGNDKRKYNVFTLLANLNENKNKPIQFELKEKGPCLDGEALKKVTNGSTFINQEELEEAHRDASISLSSGKLCWSLERLARFSTTQIKLELLSLYAHELAHWYGWGHPQAYYLYYLISEYSDITLGSELQSVVEGYINAAKFKIAQIFSRAVKLDEVPSILNTGDFFSTEPLCTSISDTNAFLVSIDELLKDSSFDSKDYYRKGFSDLRSSFKKEMVSHCANYEHEPLGESLQQILTTLPAFWFKFAVITDRLISYKLDEYDHNVNRQSQLGNVSNSMNFSYASLVFTITGDLAKEPYNSELLECNTSEGTFPFGKFEKIPDKSRPVKGIRLEKNGSKILSLINMSCTQPQEGPWQGVECVIQPKSSSHSLMSGNNSNMWNDDLYAAIDANIESKQRFDFYIDASQENKSHLEKITCGFTPQKK